MFFFRKPLGVLCFAAFGTTFIPDSRVEADPSRAGIGVSGYVAVFFLAELSGGIFPTSGRIALGQLTELCNTSSGYRVIMSYPSGLQGARILVDGISTTLDGSGQAIIADSRTAAYRVRQLELDMTTLSQERRGLGLNLGFRAVPNGGV